MKKVALYDPFLDILGGGELHVLSILKVLTTHGYEPTIFWDKNLTIEIKKKFSLEFNICLKYLPNIFRSGAPFLKKRGVLKDFDCFIYVTDGSYFFSSAKKNFVFCMVPDKNLYQMTPLNRLKTHNYSFITNSLFTSKWLHKWNIKNTSLHPYIGNDFFEVTKREKKNVILSIGRFFPHLHSKRHEKLIDVFMKLKTLSKNFKDYRLVLAGGLKKEDYNYFNQLKKLVKTSDSVVLKPNIGFQELYKLYKLSKFYWHFTGFGADENQHPEMVEHFGIAPLQAMAAGCITFCYDAGGPKEFIKNGQNGFLFNSVEDLVHKITVVSSNFSLQETIIQNGIRTVKNNFSYTVFKKEVKNIFL